LNDDFVKSFKKSKMIEKNKDFLESRLLPTKKGTKKHKKKIKK